MKRIDEILAANATRRIALSPERLVARRAATVGSEFLVSGERDAARAHLVSSVRRRPDAFALTRLGQLLKDDGNPEDAVVAFREALRLAPHNTFAMVGLASATADLQVVSVSDLVDQLAQMAVAVRSSKNALPALRVAVRLLTAIGRRTGWDLDDPIRRLEWMIDGPSPRWLEELTERIELAIRMIESHTSAVELATRGVARG